MCDPQELVDAVKSRGGFPVQTNVDGRAVRKTYHPGHYVHPIHANKALDDPASFEIAAITIVAPTQIVLACSDGSVAVYCCVEAERLSALMFRHLLNAESGEPCAKTFSRGNGAIALLSRRWHLLAVPLSATTRELPARLSIPQVLQIRDGAVEATIEGPEGIWFALFNLRPL
ncbi:MAG TPA: hypothetical protein VNL70_00635 [Tepidisphaeraceae bacterium]|nr:hypothetical protein [Tepidisphaeraceae bacterium]